LLLHLGVLGIIAAVTPAATQQSSPLPAIVANDNRTPAGRVQGSVLTVEIDAIRGRWSPDGPGTPAAVVDAFAQRGHAPLVPGPLLRIPEGTDIRIRVRNLLDKPLVVHDLGDLPATDDQPFTVASGATRSVWLHAGKAGTYAYWAATSAAPIEHRWAEDALLSGVIVVDPPGAHPDDRIFVLSVWSGAHKKNGQRSLAEAVDTINGRSYPATERLSYRQGQTVTWRLVNTSAETHPMHLHGFPFAVLARGNGRSVTPVTGEREVTERLVPDSTALVQWTADRPGAWLFHCHIVYHSAPHDPDAVKLAGKLEKHFDFDATHLTLGSGMSMDAMMGGMILAVNVAPRDASARPVAVAPARRLQLAVEPVPGENEDVSKNTYPGFRFALSENGVPVASTSHGAPPIVLVRGVPVGISVVDRLDEPTSVHWHGIDVQDSYFDGSGLPDPFGRPSSMVMPGRSFEARFTPMRAGTFMYHTHMDDMWQLPAGLAGPLIVLDPGERFDPATDHVVMITLPRSENDWDKVDVNGELYPTPIAMTVGVHERLRLLNMTAFHTDAVARIVPSAAATFAPWELIAVDGLDLPTPRPVAAETGVQFTVGQTKDVTFTSPAAGTYTLEIDDGFGGRVLATVPLIVAGERP
jgi:FtsP/CotA-like multicopper oxidase with cupredoxin domain